MNHPTPEQIIHDQLTDYRIKRDQKRFARRVFILASAILLSGAVFLFIGVFLFSLRTIAVTGSERYSYEEIVQASGISLEDNLLMLSESEVSASIKKACPYVKEVILQKEYPDAVTIVIKEEFITFAYDMLGDYYLFNHALTVLDRFESLDDIYQVRTPILVNIPFPKSCIVSQAILFSEDATYVYDMIETLSISQIASHVSEIDLSDKYIIKLIIGNVQVEFGDYLMAEEKLLALYRLLIEPGQKMSGTVDLSYYPRCFYNLTPDNPS